LFDYEQSLYFILNISHSSTGISLDEAETISNVLADFKNTDVL